MSSTPNSESRPTLKGRSDNYAEARQAILKRARQHGAPDYMWLEAIEGTHSPIDYAIHASNQVETVPPFAIEVYHHGHVESYEANREVIAERAVMPEELRQRIVKSQRASGLIDRMTISPAPVPGMRR